jgi:hypothetical protein
MRERRCLRFGLCLSGDLSDDECKAYGPRLRPGNRLKVSGTLGPRVRWPVGGDEAVAREELPQVLVHKHL